MRITHLDCPTYMASSDSVEQLFEKHHISPKRGMYERACHELGHSFVPFVVSTDGVLSEPAKGLLQTMATKTADKWGAEGAGKRSVIVAHLRAKLGAAIVKGASWCIRGDRFGRSWYVDRRAVEVDGGARAELRYLHSSQASQRPC